MARSWVVPVVFDCPALNLNQTLHKRVKSARIKEIREAARDAATNAGVPHLDRFSAELHFVPTQNGRRDPENWTPTSKAMVDGLVLAGVADDDSPRYFEPRTPVMDAPLKGDYLTRYYLIVREVPDTPAHECPVTGCPHNEENP